MASELDNVFTSLRNDQRRRLEQNAKAQRRREIKTVLGDVAIGLYKANMEKKSTDFLNTAQAIEGRNVYNRAQALDKVYADHELKALNYATGEEGYIKDTFVIPYAQKVLQADEDYAFKSDEDKVKILNEFATNFGTDIADKYRAIQAQRKGIDLTKNYQKFLEDNNVFESMGSNILTRITGGKTRKDVLLESQDNIVKQLASNIDQFSAMSLYEAGADLNTVETWANTNIDRFDDEMINMGTKKLDLYVVDGKPLRDKEVIVKQNKRTGAMKFFELTPDADGNLREVSPSGKYWQSKTFTTKDPHGGEVSRTAYIEILDGEQVNSTEPKSGIVDPNEGSQATQAFLTIPNAQAVPDNIITTANRYLNKRLPDQRGDSSVGEVMIDLYDEYVDASGNDDLEYSAWQKNFADDMAREQYKIGNAFNADTNGIDSYDLAFEIVLNRRQLSMRSGRYREQDHLFQGTSTQHAGANPLELLGGFVNLVEKNKVPLTPQNLGMLSIALDGLGAERQAQILRGTNKAAVLNQFLNSESMKNFFNREYLESTIVGGTPQDRAIVVQGLLDNYDLLRGQSRTPQTEKDKVDAIEKSFKEETRTVQTRRGPRERVVRVPKEAAEEAAEGTTTTEEPPSLLEKQRPDIPESVQDKVDFVGNIFNDNDSEKLFMQRLVNQESRFGKASGTYDLAGPKGRRGSFGVAQVDEVAFNQVKSKLQKPGQSLYKYIKPFKSATGIDLSEVKYEDLRNDVLSIAFGRMYLLQRTATAIPGDKQGQANYWKRFYNTSAGAGTPEDFLNTNADL